MAMSIAAKAPVASPMGELNTTPLIDVMLCLLVMMILSIPAQTHAVKVDLPVAPPGQVIERGYNDLSITADNVVLWNGVAVTPSQLQANINATLRMEPVPELRFQPDAAARYVVVDSVLAQVRRSGVTAMGFVGNERFAREF